MVSFIKVNMWEFLFEFIYILQKPAQDRQCLCMVESIMHLIRSVDCPRKFLLQLSLLDTLH